ncbi:uncharacterized protein PHACADRAFT_182515 [Phanerochaete carnosa HHB-10118-sp]|uniref:RING-type domain-containing protein n=1 Tax=Phanerochaete carnosa (strain HHB-10118-sp) TaxID=650164 RepID=K5WGA6_PHACS|nr:uncharacterized protein PHACADRAFT_182515 [Phanerochaete carnosa HHB-10118-sp]EKM58134.1 hypothetical protein PHACADRAFT_182515 [Phanerochaete carnosa HHB-10118-sp]
MASTLSGMPLLSGPPPGPDENENACRKCNKEFNVLFARSRKCNHCGHLYCQSCTDYQALMPRQGGGNAGYDPASVCAYCIENLTITAAGKGQLRKYSLAKLRKYAKDYDINVNGVIEKDDLIDKIIAARTPHGCLPIANERSDRPRGIFTRAMEAMGSSASDSAPQQPQHSSQHSPQQQQPPPYQPRQRTTSHPPSFPRPDLDDQQPPPPPQPNQSAPRPQPQPQRQQQQQRQDYHTHSQTGPGRQQHTYAPPPRSTYSFTYQSRSPPSQSQTLPRSRPQYNPPPGPPPGHSTHNARGASNSGSRTHLNVPPSGSARPRSASAPRTPRSGSPSRGTSPAPTAVPSLGELLAMAPEALSALSISTLKAVLFRNHVSAGMIVEKAELVAKVRALVEDERHERAAARRRMEEEEESEEAREQREMEEVLERSRREHEEYERRRREEQAGEQDDAMQSEEREAAPDTSSAATDSTAPPQAEKEKAKGTTPAGKLSPKAQAMASHLERTGLCVICQDEEANIAIVDCGHLAMCRACSDLVMNSSRECPLCRTRIVTEARLLRIFKA